MLSLSIGRIIRESFQKHLKYGVVKGKNCSERNITITYLRMKLIYESSLSYQMCLAKVVMVTAQASQNKEFPTTEQWSSSRSYFNSDDRSPLERLAIMTCILRILLTLKLVTFTSQ